MTSPTPPESLPAQISAPRAVQRRRLGLIALYLVCLAVLARGLVSTEDPVLRLWYLVLQSAFIVLYTLCWWQRLTPPLRVLIFGVQCALVLVALSLDPEQDFFTALFVVLSYQATLVFSARVRRLAVGLCVLLIGVSLMVFLGPLRGLALALIPIAAGIIIPAYVVANEEIEASRAKSEHMVGELESTYRQLEAYAGEAEALAGVEERNHLARELHDSVSQTLFTVQLLTSSAQMLLQKNPKAVRPQLERLQELTKNALGQMRGLIADLDSGRGQD